MEPPSIIAGIWVSRRLAKGLLLLREPDRHEMAPLGDKVSKGRLWGPAMKYALESVTLATFAVFLAWGLRLLVAWA